MKDDICVTGMILSSMPIGEYDKRLVILTRELGKVHAFARGARRQNSALLAASQPFTFGKFFLRPGKDAYALTGAKVQNYFMELREDIEILYYGYYFLEVGDFFGQEGLDENETLKLIYMSCRALTSHNAALPARLIKAIFDYKMLAIEGYVAPQMPEEETKGLSNGAIYALSYICESKEEKLYTFTVNDSVLAEMEGFIDKYRKKYMDGHFKSLEML